MVEMRKNGEITEVSLGMNYVEWIDRLLHHYPAGTFDSLMIAGSWNLIDQSAYDTLIFCENQNIEVINASVFCGGLLFGGNYYRYKSPVPEEVKEKVAKWKALCEKHKVDFHVVLKTKSRVEFDAAAWALERDNIEKKSHLPLLSFLLL